MMQWLNDALFGATMTPHGFCLTWDPALLSATIIGHGLTALAYMGLPLAILLEARRRRLLMPRWILGLFAGFIGLCGLSHMAEIWTLWFPAYWLSAGLDLATGAVSCMTLAMLPFAEPRDTGSAYWWRRARVFRHDLRGARTEINLLRDAAGKPAIDWPDDSLPRGPETDR